MPKYSRAPIVEAVIQITVDEAPPIPLGSLFALVRSEEDRYAQHRELFSLHTEVNAGARLSTAASQVRVGYALKDAAGRFVAQLKTQGFVFSRLAPYESWNEFSLEARRLWAKYRAAVGDRSVTRVGVRYINRLDVIPGQDLKRFVRTQPEIAPSIPQQLSQFFMQLVIPDEGSLRTLVINEALTESPVAGRVGLVLDIDLFQNRDLPGQEEELWAFLEVLRVRKNEVFEACLTEEAKEMIR